MANLRVDNPYTLETACEVPLAEWSEVERVLDNARKGAAAAAALSLADRKALVERATAAMEANADTIATGISRMMGKPKGQALGEVKGMAGRARAMLAQQTRAWRRWMPTATTASWWQKTSSPSQASRLLRSGCIRSRPTSPRNFTRTPCRARARTRA